MMGAKRSSADISIATSLKILGFVVMLLSLGGLAFYLYGITVVKWWLPIGISLVLSIGLWVLSSPIWQRWMPETPTWARCAVHTVCVTIALCAVLLSANRMGLRKDSIREINVEISDKYKQKHYKSRRVGRGRYVKGEAYDVYFLVCTFPDGKRKTLEVKVETYNKNRINSYIPMRVGTGLFNWPVILEPGLR